MTTKNPLDHALKTIKGGAQTMLDQAAQSATQALTQEVSKIGGSFPAPGPAPVQNPAPRLTTLPPLARMAAVQNPDDDDDDDDADDDDDGQHDADPDTPAVFFETPNADYNLACAVGAYRAAGGDGCLVATHKAGQAFFGTAEQLTEHCARHNHKTADWGVEDDQAEIMEMEYERAGIQLMMRRLDEQEAAWGKALKAQEDFHWGDKANATGVVTIPGVTGPAVFLGVARRIEYGAQKQGKWEEYFHEHGEESGTFPSIYGIGEPDDKGDYRAFVVYGGNMHIQDRGIID